MLLLAFNLGNEYRAFNGDTPLDQLDTFVSILNRTGIDSWFDNDKTAARHLVWLPFLKGQFASIDIMSVPFVLLGLASVFDVEAGWNRALTELQSLFTGIFVYGAYLMGLYFVCHRTLDGYPAAGRVRLDTAIAPQCLHP